MNPLQKKLEKNRGEVIINGRSMTLTVKYCYKDPDAQVLDYK
jgi:hypothetical protein